MQGNCVLWGNPVPKSYSNPFVKVGQIVLWKSTIIDIGSGLSEGGIVIVLVKYNLYTDIPWSVADGVTGSYPTLLADHTQKTLNLGGSIVITFLIN